jgi:hypothetical protein
MVDGTSKRSPSGEGALISRRLLDVIDYDDFGSGFPGSQSEPELFPKRRRDITLRGMTFVFIRANIGQFYVVASLETSFVDHRPIEIETRKLISQRVDFAVNT